MLFENENQFLLGSALMVSPVIKGGARKKTTFFPDEKYYNLFNGKIMNQNGESVLNVEAELSDLPIFIHSGYIVPLQSPQKSYVISEMRKKPIEIVIALDDAYRATGSIYLDDGESIYSNF